MDFPRDWLRDALRIPKNRVESAVVGRYFPCSGPALLSEKNDKKPKTKCRKQKKGVTTEIEYGTII